MNRRYIGSFQRRLSQQELAKRQHELPVFPCIRVGDRGDLLRSDCPPWICEQLLVQSALDRASVARRHQLGTREISLQELIRDHEPATRTAIEQVVAAGDPEISHRRDGSPLIFTRLRRLSDSLSSSASMNENALP